MNFADVISQIYKDNHVPLTTGLCLGEASDSCEFVGEFCSTLTAGMAKEGTNSTALTFNVENFAVTSAECDGELFADVESASVSHESGAVLLDIFNLSSSLSQNKKIYLTIIILNLYLLSSCS